MGVDPKIHPAAGVLAPAALRVAKYQELYKRLVGGEGEMEYVAGSSPDEKS